MFKLAHYIYMRENPVKGFLLSLLLYPLTFVLGLILFPIVLVWTIYHHFKYRNSIGG